MESNKQDTSEGSDLKKNKSQTEKKFYILQLGQDALNWSVLLVFIPSFILVIYVLQDVKELKIEKDVILALVSYTSTFAALCLALPHFLRDFEKQETLWRSFLLLSLMYILATIVGLFTLVIYSTQNIFELEIQSPLPRLLIIPIFLRILISVLDLLMIKIDLWLWKLDHYKIIEFLIILLVLFISLPFSSGESAAFVLMVFYSSAFLLSLILGLVFNMLLYSGNDKKKAVILHKIKILLESELNRAFTLNELFERIQETSDGEIKSNFLSKYRTVRWIKQSLLENDQNIGKYIESERVVIPVVKTEYFDKLNKILSNHIFVFIQSSPRQTYCDLLLKTISDKSGLSVSLIKYISKLMETAVEGLLESEVVSVETKGKENNEKLAILILKREEITLKQIANQGDNPRHKFEDKIIFINDRECKDLILVDLFSKNNKEMVINSALQTNKPIEVKYFGGFKNQKKRTNHNAEKGKGGCKLCDCPKFNADSDSDSDQICINRNSTGGICTHRKSEHT